MSLYINLITLPLAFKIRIRKRPATPTRLIAHSKLEGLSATQLPPAMALQLMNFAMPKMPLFGSAQSSSASTQELHP